MPCVSTAPFFARSSRRGCLRVVPSAPVRRSRGERTGRFHSRAAASPPATPPSQLASPPRPKPRSRPRHAGPVKLSFRRWGVICSKDAQDAGLGDLVTVELSKEKGLELVDRADLDAVTKELQLAAVFEAGAAAERLKMGQLLKADALLLLSIGNAPKGRALKIVVSECRCGARLRIEYLPYEQRMPRRSCAALRRDDRRGPPAVRRRNPPDGRRVAVLSKTSCTITTTCRRFTRGCWKSASCSCPTSR